MSAVDADRPPAPPAAPAAPRMPADHPWRRVPLVGLGLGLAGLGAAAALGWRTPELAGSYLVAFTFFVSLALGALFFLLTQLAGGAVWSVVLRRLMEHLAGTLPLFVLLFAPVALTARELYGAPGGDAFAPAAFTARSAAYLLLWAALGWYFRYRSLRQDAGDGEQAAQRLRRAAGPALVLCVGSTTLASFEWLTPLAPGWRSTIFGAYFLAGAALGGVAALTLVALLARRAGLLARELTAAHCGDLGRYLFAFTALWAYIAFAQYLVVWYGNLPAETIWYARRAGGWSTTSALLVVCHAVVPLLALLPQAVKRSPRLLGLAATWLLAAHGLDIYWLIMPALQPHGPHPSLRDGLTLLGVGGLCAALVGHALRSHALVPLNDPLLPASLAHGRIAGDAQPVPDAPADEEPAR